MKLDGMRQWRLHLHVIDAIDLWTLKSIVDLSM